MGAIKSAADAQYFGKRGHEIYESGERSSHAQDLSETSNEGNSSELKDKFEFSAKAQEILRKVAGTLEDLLEEHSEYSHIFPSSKGRTTPSQHALSGLAFMGQFRSFLNNPQFQKLAQQDSQFGDFYQKIDTLGRMSQVALSQTQQRARDQSPATYARPRKILD